MRAPIFELGIPHSYTLSFTHDFAGISPCGESALDFASFDPFTVLAAFCLSDAANGVLEPGLYSLNAFASANTSTSPFDFRLSAQSTFSFTLTLTPQ